LEYLLIVVPVFGRKRIYELPVLYLVFRQPVSVVGMNPFLQQIALIPYCFYPSGIISEDMGEVIGSEIVSFAEYINHKDAATAYPGKLPDGFSFLIPEVIIYI